MSNDNAALLKKLRTEGSDLLANWRRAHVNQLTEEASARGAGENASQTIEAMTDEPYSKILSGWDSAAELAVSGDLGLAQNLVGNLVCNFPGCRAADQGKNCMAAVRMELSFVLAKVCRADEAINIRTGKIVKTTPFIRFMSVLGTFDLRQKSRAKNLFHVAGAMPVDDCLVLTCWLQELAWFVSDAFGPESVNKDKIAVAALQALDRSAFSIEHIRNAFAKGESDGFWKVDTKGVLRLNKRAIMQMADQVAANPILAELKSLDAVVQELRTQVCGVSITSEDEVTFSKAKETIDESRKRAEPYLSTIKSKLASLFKSGVEEAVRWREFADPKEKGGAVVDPATLTRSFYAEYDLRPLDNLTRVVRDEIWKRENSPQVMKKLDNLDGVNFDGASRTPKTKTRSGNRSVIFTIDVSSRELYQENERLTALMTESTRNFLVLMALNTKQGIDAPIAKGQSIGSGPTAESSRTMLARQIGRDRTNQIVLCERKRGYRLSAAVEIVGAGFEPTIANSEAILDSRLSRPSQARRQSAKLKRNHET